MDRSCLPSARSTSVTSGRCSICPAMRRSRPLRASVDRADRSSFILSIGVPKANFQDLHRMLAAHLIEAGIQVEAKSSGGQQILVAMQASIVGAWHLEVPESPTIDFAASLTRSRPRDNLHVSAPETDMTSTTSDVAGGVDNILAAAAWLQSTQNHEGHLPWLNQFQVTKRPAHRLRRLPMNRNMARQDLSLKTVHRPLPEPFFNGIRSLSSYEIPWAYAVQRI